MGDHMSTKIVVYVQKGCCKVYEVASGKTKTKLHESTSLRDAEKYLNNKYGW